MSIQGEITRLPVIANLLLASTLTGTAVLATPAHAAPARAQVPTVTHAAAGTLSSTVTGSFTDTTGQAGVLSGTFTPNKFLVQNNTLLATGTLHAVLTDAAGTPVGTTDRTVTLPVQLPTTSNARAAALPACPILHLVLGPLDLNLLGLTVHLNTIVLDITAQPGPGNLLCAITGLLNGRLPLPLNQIAALNNQILALLNL